MSDVVVTVPKNFTHPAAPGRKGLAAWIAEGDAAGESWSGQLWGFVTYGSISLAHAGDRCYVVCEGRLRGYSPIVQVMYDQSCFRNGQAPVKLIRGGDAVAVTIPERIDGFRGMRRRWWDRSEEIPFPDWRTAK